MVFTEFKSAQGNGKAGKLNLWICKKYAKQWSEYTNVQRKIRTEYETKQTKPNHKVNKSYHLIT
jgi:hypothetical protein